MLSIVFFLFLSDSAGLPTDPSLNPDLHTRRRDQADHPSSQEPAPAPIRTEELRVRLPHPGGDSQCPRPALQQHLHPVPENSGE